MLCSDEPTLCLQEEDPPQMLNAHTYDTQVNTINAAESPIISIPAPAPTAKRRPGRPRKLPPTLNTPDRPLVREQRPGSDEEETSTTLEGTGNKDTPSKFDTSTDSTSGSTASTRSSAKSPVKSERQAIVSTHRQTSADISPTQDEAKKLLPIKRGRGRPPRVIKRPRKYLDSYDEELTKPDPYPVVDCPEDVKEDDSEEEEENEEEAADGEDPNQMVNEALQTLGQKSECPKCGKKFTTASNCHRHILKDRCSHSHQCGFCDKQFR